VWKNSPDDGPACRVRPSLRRVAAGRSTGAVHSRSSRHCS